MVCRTFRAPQASRRRLRRGKPRDVSPDDATFIPLTQLTVIDAEPIDGDAEEWMRNVRDDEDTRTRLAEHGFAVAVRALAAWRLASADAGVPDPSIESALAVRIGYGGGDALVDGRFTEAVELAPPDAKSTRSAALRPQERMAAILSGRERPLACEELVVRARSDIDAGRDREAALQVRVALEALLAERQAVARATQEDDLAFLEERRRITGEAANEALGGSLSPERLEEVTQTLAVCERVLRRRAAHG